MIRRGSQDRSPPTPYRNVERARPSRSENINLSTTPLMTSIIPDEESDVARSPDPAPYATMLDIRVAVLRLKPTPTVRPPALVDLGHDWVHGGDGLLLARRGHWSCRDNYRDCERSAVVGCAQYHHYRLI